MGRDDERGLEAGGERGCPRCKFWTRPDDPWCPNCGLAYPAGGAPAEYVEAARGLRPGPLPKLGAGLAAALLALYFGLAAAGLWSLSLPAAAVLLAAAVTVWATAWGLERRRRRLCEENLRALTPRPLAPTLGDVYARNKERIREIDVRLRRLDQPMVREDLKSVGRGQRKKIAGAFEGRRRELAAQRRRAESLCEQIDFLRWQSRASLLLYQAQNRLDAAALGRGMRSADITRLLETIRESAAKGEGLLRSALSSAARPTEETANRARRLVTGLRRQAEELSGRRLLIAFATAAIEDAEGGDPGPESAGLAGAAERADDLNYLALTRQELGMIHAIDGEIEEALARIESSPEAERAPLPAAASDR